MTYAGFAQACRRLIPQWSSLCALQMPADTLQMINDDRPNMVNHKWWPPRIES